MKLEPGHIYIANDDRHVRIIGSLLEGGETLFVGVHRGADGDDLLLKYHEDGIFQRGGALKIRDLKSEFIPPLWRYFNLYTRRGTDRYHKDEESAQNEPVPPVTFHRRDMPPNERIAICRVDLTTGNVETIRKFVPPSSALNP